MDFNEIITFEGGLNTDDTPQSMPKGDYRDFSYCRLGYNSGNAFAVETSNGTIEITNYTITTEDKVLGAAQWIKENAIVYFLYRDTQYHEIWVYYIATQTHRRVIQNTVLNFSSDWPILHANVIDDILKWTDGRWDPVMYDADGTRLFNPPYQINLRKALDNFYSFTDLQTIDAIKWPMEPPILSYYTDPTRNDNKLRNKLFKFIIQPIYENGEIGVWSMYSTLELPNTSELVSGTNWISPNNDNAIQIQFDSGPKVIRKFNIAVQQFDKDSLGVSNPPFGIFLQLDKDQDVIGDNQFHTVTYYGSTSTSPATDVFKNYDRVPVVAECQEYLPTNQLVYINFREGYDKPTETPFLLNVQMGYDINEVRWSPQDFTGLFEVKRFNIESGLAIRFKGSAYADVNLKFVFQVSDVIQFVTWNTPPAAGEQYRNRLLYYSVSQEDVNNALLESTPYDQNAYIMRLMVKSFVEQWNATGYFCDPTITISDLGTTGMQAEISYNKGVNNTVRTADTQEISPFVYKRIIGGDFTYCSSWKTGRIARVNGEDDDAEVDESFYTGIGFNNSVNSIKVQPDNYIVVGGKFTSYDVQNNINRIARLLVDGGLDFSFASNVGTGFNSTVQAIALQSDGKIVVVGDFTEFNNQPRNKIARLNSDGTLDGSFTVGAGISGGQAIVNCVTIRPDGKILIGGNFTTYDTSSRKNIALLNIDGTLSSETTTGSGFNDTIHTINYYQSPFSTDTIFVGGEFTDYNGTTRERIAALNTDLTLNASTQFNFGSGLGFNDTVYTIAQAEMDPSLAFPITISVGGKFSTYKGVTANRLAEIYFTGTANIGDGSTINFDGDILNILRVNDSGTNSLYIMGDFVASSPPNTDARRAIALMNDVTEFDNEVVGATQVFLPYSTTSPPDLIIANYDRSTSVKTSLKVGATHEFGIVYGDRGYRDSTVYTVDSMNVFVPWFYDIGERFSFSDFKNPFTVTPNITINHIPPVWATKYWIVAKPATEISSFGQYVTNQNQGKAAYQSSIVLDSTNNRYKIFLDSYYQNTNRGSSVRHEIRKGDKLRFKRTNAYFLDYIPYLEIDILDVDTATGPNGEKIIYTNLFQPNLVEPNLQTTGAGFFFGQEVEIYTPRKATDDTGNLFISTWNDVTEAIQINDPHTTDRAHGSPIQYYLQYSPNVFGGVYFYLNGDESQLFGTTWPITIHNADGSIETTTTVIQGATYDSIQNATRLELSSVSASPEIAYITLNTQDQIVNNLVSTTPASYPINYGDVYLRQRNHATGFGNPTDVFYYYQEDPNYSDYWSSNVHCTGRVRVEDPNANMTHRKATAIHSDAYISGTQINGLSSFGLDNQNIQDLNPLFGPVIKSMMSGREGKTLKCLQGNKENSIYIQFYPNEVGSDSSVRISNRTFASWFDYKSLFGCTNAGATALLPNGAVMYFDNNSGVFIYSGGNGQMIVSEIDPDTGKDYKFRTKTKQLAKAYNDSPNPVVRTYVNETVGEVGFAFKLQKIDLIGTEINPDEITYEEESFISNDGSQYQLGDFIEIIDIESGDVLFTGNVVGIIANIIRVGPDPIFNTIPAETAVINRSRYVYYNDHVVFDYVNMRWRSTYDYNFIHFCNFGQTLVGWGENNQLYLHNQPGEWTFHGDSFIQKVKFVSNENPLLLKRYQDITLISDDKFSIEAVSEPNKSYPLGMKTMMTENLLGMFEGYGKTNYRKNLYDPKFWVSGNVSTTNSNTWTLNGNQTGLNGEMISIVQDDKNVYTGIIDNPVYSSGPNTTEIELVNLEPNTYGVEGKWYLSEKVLLNGEDIRANALTHTLSYDPAPDGIPREGSILFSVGIKGVLS